MDTTQSPGAAAPVNEGEGSRTAARKYNNAQRRFVGSSKVEEGARAAAQALDGPERQELLEAEAIGKSRAAGEDPDLAGSSQADGDEKIRARAYEIWECEGRPHGRHHDHWRQAQRDIASE